MKKVLIILLAFCFSCTSKVKEGAYITVNNATQYDLFVVDRYTFDNLRKEEKIPIFTIGLVNSNTNKTRAYLKEEYVTLYANKSFFFSINDYNNNNIYNNMRFYFIRRENLSKTKEEILSHKLYDSITIDLEYFYHKGSNNYIYVEDDVVYFKND